MLRGCGVRLKTTDASWSSFGEMQLEVLIQEQAQFEERLMVWSLAGERGGESDEDSLVTAVPRLYRQAGHLICPHSSLRR